MLIFYAFPLHGTLCARVWVVLKRLEIWGWGSEQPNTILRTELVLEQEIAPVWPFDWTHYSKNKKQKKSNKWVWEKELGPKSHIAENKQKQTPPPVSVFQYLCPSLSAVWSEGQLDRPRPFLSHPNLYTAVQSQQKTCTGNCQTQSCPDNKKMKCFQSRAAVSQRSYSRLVKNGPTVPLAQVSEFCMQ